MIRQFSPNQWLLNKTVPKFILTEISHDIQEFV